MFNFPKIDLEEAERRLACLAERREASKNEMAGLLASKEGYRAKRDALRNEFDLGLLQKAEYAQESVSARLVSAEASIKALGADIEGLADRIDGNDGLEASLVRDIKDIAKELQSALDIAQIPPFDLELIKEKRHDLENARRRHAVAKSRVEAEARAVESFRAALAPMKEKIGALKRRIRGEYGAEAYSLEELEDLPDMVEDIEGEIQMVRARLEAIGSQTDAARLYENKDRERKRLGDTIDEMKVHRSGLIDRLESEKRRLIKAIYAYLAPLNEYFSGMFEKLGFIGRLELSAEDGWGLHILVRFREGEELQQLSSYRQSGGEKSLSTVLFLLALQQTEPAPFRLVDEINQGMDAVNEQAVFSIMRDMSMQSQFFIITPKLVRGLEFSESTNSIILYGGPGITSDLENYAHLLLQQ